MRGNDENDNEEGAGLLAVYRIRIAKEPEVEQLQISAAKFIQDQEKD